MKVGVSPENVRVDEGVVEERSVAESVREIVACNGEADVERVAVQRTVGVIVRSVTVPTRVSVTSIV